MTEASAGMDETAADIVGTIQAAWTDAFARRDVERLVALYSRCTAFYGSTAELYTDHAGIREYFTKLPPQYRWVRFAPPHLVPLGPHAVAASGEAVFGAIAGGEEKLLPYRMTHVLLRTDSGWAIATHHASPVPGR